MTQSIEKNFNFLYENDSTSNYLVLRTGIDKSIINYQVQMLLNNKPGGLLEFNINYTGEKINCFYNVTSKCTLASFMFRKRFTRDEFLITILNIINNIYQLKNYLLYDNNILLDENFIYIEPESIEVYFVYLPFIDCKNDIKDFFIRLIFKLVKFHDEYSDNYIQRILEVIKNDNFNLSNLKSLIENLLGEEIKKQPQKSLIIEDRKIEDSETIKNGLFKANKAQKEREKVKPENNKIDIFNADKTKKNKSVITRGNVRIPNSLNIKKQEPQNIVKKSKHTMSEQDNEKDNQGKKMDIHMIAMILLQPFLLFTAILTLNSSFVKMSDNPANTVIILILIFLAVDVLVLRIINEKRKKTDETGSCMPLQFITDKMKCKTKQKVKKLPPITNDKQENQLPVLNENYNGETVIIRRSKLTEIPYLKEKDGEGVVEINKKSILIGRLESFVDYVINNSAIGKIHAEIIQEGEEFYIMDCNSRNGTFLNDNRILPNTKNRVSSNDLLRFANKEFIFMRRAL